MAIKFHNGFWTVFCNGAPVLACVSLQSAQEKLACIK